MVIREMEKKFRRHLRLLIFLWQTSLNFFFFCLFLIIDFLKFICGIFLSGYLCGIGYFLDTFLDTNYLDLMPEEIKKCIKLDITTVGTIKLKI